MKKLLTFFSVLTISSMSMLNAQNLYTKTFSMDDVIPNATGWSYWFIPTGSVADTLNVKMSCVNTGNGSHAPHRHNHDEYFILLEGDALFHLNGEEIEVHTGDGFYAPGAGSHSLSRTDPDKPIRYLMFNREARGGVKTPFPFWIEDYKIADCYFPYQDKTFWYLDPKMTFDGLNVKSVKMKGKNVNKEKADDRYLVYVIMEGVADITVDGQKVRLPAMSVCYVPAGSASTITSADSKIMKYLAVRIH